LHRGSVLRGVSWRDSLVPSVLLARQPGTWKVSPVRLARHLHVGSASSAGDIASWRVVLQVCLQVCRLLQLYIYRVACMVKKQSRVGLGFWPLVLYIFFYKTNLNLLNFYASFSSPTFLLSPLLSFCEWVRVCTWVGAALPLFCFCCVASIIHSW